MTSGFKLTILWLCAAAAALVVALAPVSASFIDQQYLPIGPDSFYHARRILDAVADPSGFFQFDTHMHVPEGSLVTWPWAYDYSLSLLVRAALAMNLTGNDMAALVHIPAVAFPIAILLVLSICRSLNLPPSSTLLAMLATAFFPLNQSLYGIGNIDHHFAEHLFVLGTLAAALGWLRHPEQRWRAVIAGLVFGSACGVHSALFALQLILLGALFTMWVKRMPQPAHAPWFAAALIGAQLLVALPSLALREGDFDYFTLSWFQVYAAVCTAVFVLLLARVQPGLRSIVLLVVVAATLAIPGIHQVALAGDFFANKITGMDEISEVQSVLAQWRNMGSLTYLATLYTWMIVLLPLTGALCAWQLWRTRDAACCHFWVASLAGLAMLFLQLRLQYFGSFALYLPWIVFLAAWAGENRARALTSGSIAGIVLAVSYLPGLRSHVFVDQVVAGDANYAVTRPVYPALASECARQPGVVLADPDDGHYLRFHTECSVIGNPFLVTRQHVEKVLEEKRLLSLPARELARAAPQVRYVYVRSATMFFVSSDGILQFAPGEYPDHPNYPMVRELLAADPLHLPAGFRMISDLRRQPADPPYARVFAVEE